MTLNQLITTFCTLALISLSGCSNEPATSITGEATTSQTAPGATSKTVTKTATPSTTIAGEWTLTIDTPRGVQNPKVQISEANGTLSGTYESFRGPIDIASVTVDGNRFSFPLILTVPIGEIEVNYEGTIEGDRMVGLVKNPRGEVPFSGVRTGS